MDEKIDRGKNFFEVITQNMFIYFVLSYSIIIYYYFIKGTIDDSKYVIEAHKFLTQYNQLILFVSMSCFFIACILRMLLGDHSLGIDEDGNNAKAINYWLNVFKLEKIWAILFFTIIQFSLFYDLTNSIRNLISFVILSIVSAIISKVFVLLKKKYINRYS